MPEVTDFSLKDYLTNEQKDTILANYKDLVNYTHNLEIVKAKDDTVLIEIAQESIDNLKSEIRSYFDKVIPDYFYYRCRKDNLELGEDEFNVYFSYVNERLFRDNIIDYLGKPSVRGGYAGRTDVIKMISMIMNHAYYKAAGKATERKPEIVGLEKPISPELALTREEVIPAEETGYKVRESEIKRIIKEYVSINFGEDVKGDPEDYLRSIIEYIISPIETAEKTGENLLSVMKSSINDAISNYLPTYKEAFKDDFGAPIDSLSDDQIPGEWQWLKELSNPDKVMSVIMNILRELKD